MLLSPRCWQNKTVGVNLQRSKRTILNHTERETVLLYLYFFYLYFVLFRTFSIIIDLNIKWKKYFLIIIIIILFCLPCGGNGLCSQPGTQTYTRSCFHLLFAVHLFTWWCISIRIISQPIICRNQGVRFGPEQHREVENAMIILLLLTTSTVKALLAIQDRSH